MPRPPRPRRPVTETPEETLRRVGNAVRETDREFNPNTARNRRPTAAQIKHAQAEYTNPRNVRNWPRLNTPEEHAAVHGRYSSRFGATSDQVQAAATSTDRVQRTAAHIRQESQLLNHSDPDVRDLARQIQEINKKAPTTPGPSTAPLAPRNPNLPNYNPDMGRGMMTHERAARVVDLERRYGGHARNLEENAVRAIRAASRAKNAATEGAGIFTRARAALNSGVLKGAEALAKTNVGRLVTAATERVGATAAGRVAGAIISKTAVPLMVAQGAYDAYSIGKEGYNAYAADRDAKANERAMTEKYGSVEAATRTRHERVKQKTKKSIEESSLKQGYLIK